VRQIAIIPARAGSKSVINKNLQKVGNRHLVSLAISACLEVDFFEKIVLTTDLETLHAEYQPSMFPPHSMIETIKRPRELATDKSKMMDVVLDVIERCDIHESDTIWLLQPSSPFRQPFHFLDIKRYLDEDGIHGVISFADVGANHPNRTYTIVNGRPKRRKYTNYENKQDLKPHYIRNGSFYVSRVDKLRKAKSFEMDSTKAYIMDDLYSINIDSPLDLFIAKSIASIGIKDTFEFMRGIT